MTPNLFPLGGTNDSVWFFTHGTWNVIRWKKRNEDSDVDVHTSWNWVGRSSREESFPKSPESSGVGDLTHPYCLLLSSIWHIDKSPFYKTLSCLRFPVTIPMALPIYHPEHLRFFQWIHLQSTSCQKSVSDLLSFLILSLQDALSTLMAFVQMPCKLLHSVPWALDSFKCLVDMFNLRY